jgi:hypothetical protein
MRFYDIQLQINNIAEVNEYLSELLVLKAKALTRDKELFYASIIDELNIWKDYWEQGKMEAEMKS